MLRRIFCKIAIIAVIVCALWALSGVLFAQGRSEEALDRVIEIQERHTDALMAIEGVEGTAVGFNPAGRLSVQVLLEKPGVGGIPQELEGVPVHPVVAGKIYALPKPSKPVPVDPTARFDRPVPIGVSTGHPAITAGTIGCRLIQGAQGFGHVYALSNNHVYADENRASPDDNVLQPGPLDGGVDPSPAGPEINNDAIGMLFEFEQIEFYDDSTPDPIPTNTIDAAIAFTSTYLLGNATPSDGYGTPDSTPVTASLRQKVQKYGRTTGLTKGQVAAINATVDVNYAGKLARFIGQIVITPGSFSAGGDSGSLIVTQTGNYPVGLLFAGSNGHTFANPIGAVLNRFGLTVDGK